MGAVALCERVGSQVGACTYRRPEPVTASRKLRRLRGASYGEAGAQSPTQSIESVRDRLRLCHTHDVAAMCHWQDARQTKIKTLVSKRAKVWLACGSAQKWKRASVWLACFVITFVWDSPAQ